MFGFDVIDVEVDHGCVVVSAAGTAEQDADCAALEELHDTGREEMLQAEGFLIELLGAGEVFGGDGDLLDGFHDGSQLLVKILQDFICRWSLNSWNVGNVRLKD